MVSRVYYIWMRNLETKIFVEFPYQININPISNFLKNVQRKIKSMVINVIQMPCRHNNMVNDDINSQLVSLSIPINFFLPIFMLWKIVYDPS